LFSVLIMLGFKFYKRIRTKNKSWILPTEHWTLC
jgi:hypothetical protein